MTYYYINTLSFFEPILESASRIHPPMKEISQLLKEQIERPVTMVPYPLPYDLVDQSLQGGEGLNNI